MEPIYKHSLVINSEKMTTGEKKVQDKDAAYNLFQYIYIYIYMDHILKS